MASFTVKQMEALYWVGTLGSFEAASHYLNLAQSTVSKRIAEMEQQFAVPLFDRSARASRLTAKGEEIRVLAEQMLRLHDRLAVAAQSADGPPLRFRMGATDLVALSWLPELLHEVMDRHPETVLEPEIDITAGLLARLADRRIDFAICPRMIEHPQFVHVPLGAIELAWMCSPGLLPDLRSDMGPVTREDLLRLPLLTQSSGSILWPVLQTVVDNSRMPFARRITCNNMVALAELAAFGLGVTILPRAFFSRHVRDGRLRMIETAVPLPQIEYFVNYRNDYHGRFFADVAEMARGICDFRLREDR